MATLNALRDQALEYDSEQRRYDREAHPKAAELAGQRQRLVELQKQLEGTRAGEGEDTEAKAHKARQIEKVIAEIEQSKPVLEEAVQKRRTWRFPDKQTQWQHDTLAGLVEELRSFLDPDPMIGTLRSVEERLAFARRIEERSIAGTEAAAKWAEVIGDIAKLKVYDGLQLAPQLGLVPLHRDPCSGLWEFWHLQTGTRPEPNPDAEAVNPWILTEDTGLVFVLLPGGTFWMGAQRRDPEGHNYDPHARFNERPVHEVTLAPFFISKYEMTQGQWQRFTGTNPSRYGPDWIWKGDPRGRTVLQQNQPWNPVEQVSWPDCRDILGRLGLVFPTEAQWEYAARAGTDSPWWTGSEKESIGAVGAGNLADGGARKGWANCPWGTVEEWLDDGWSTHAPVGSLRPNAFGLHDTIGNVWEWCRDGFAGYDTAADPGDGFRKAISYDHRMTRGGSHRNIAINARSAFRNNATPGDRNHNLGVRPARAISD
jgi:formylglycine-generating enzyme required for sulfatase activity